MAVSTRFVDKPKLRVGMTNLFRRMFRGFARDDATKTLTIKYNDTVRNMDYETMRELCIRCGAVSIDPTNEQDTRLKLEWQGKRIEISFVDDTHPIPRRQQ